MGSGPILGSGSPAVRGVCAELRFKSWGFTCELQIGMCASNADAPAGGTRLRAPAHEVPVQLLPGPPTGLWAAGLASALPTGVFPLPLRGTRDGVPPAPAPAASRFPRSLPLAVILRRREVFKTATEWRCCASSRASRSPKERERERERGWGRGRGRRGAGGGVCSPARERFGAKWLENAQKYFHSGPAGKPPGVLPPPRPSGPRPRPPAAGRVCAHLPPAAPGGGGGGRRGVWRRARREPGGGGALCPAARGPCGSSPRRRRLPLLPPPVARLRWACLGSRSGPGRGGSAAHGRRRRPASRGRRRRRRRRRRRPAARGTGGARGRPAAGEAPAPLLFRSLPASAARPPPARPRPRPLPAGPRRAPRPPAPTPATPRTRTPPPARPHPRPGSGERGKK